MKAKPTTEYGIEESSRAIARRVQAVMDATENPPAPWPAVMDVEGTDLVEYLRREKRPLAA